MLWIMPALRKGGSGVRSISIEARAESFADRVFGRGEGGFIDAGLLGHFHAGERRDVLASLDESLGQQGIKDARIASQRERPP